MGLAQEVAYSSLLAFFPAVVALVGLLDLINAYGALRELPRPGRTEGGHRSDPSSPGRTPGASGSIVALVIGLVAAVWVASRRDGLGRQGGQPAYDRMETRPFWKVRLISIVLVLASGVVTAGMLLLIVIGGTLGDAISRQGARSAARSLGVEHRRGGRSRSRSVLLLFGLVYYLAPNAEQRELEVADARVGARRALMWLALSGLFALYTSFSSSYSKTYGALATGIILLLWLNYSAWAILFGAELNSELDRQADIHAAGGEHAGLIKPARRRQ